MKHEAIQPITVLVADDNTSFRQVVAASLAEDDDICIVVEASDGRQAISLAVELVPDIVLLDMYMPGGGIAAVRSIHRQVPTTRIVVLTSSDDEDDIYDALKAGASGYVLKASSLGDLAGVVRAMTQGVGVLLSPSIATRVLDEFERNPPWLS